MWYYKNNDYTGIFEVQKISDLPDWSYGFVYLITDLSNDKYYIGKKSLFSRRWVRVAESTYLKLSKEERKGYRKTRDKKKSKRGSPVWLYKKLVVKESDWLTYTSSCKELNDEIEKGAIYHKEILAVAKDKRELTYLEVKYQFKNDVLENDNCYNTNILGRFF